MDDSPYMEVLNSLSREKKVLQSLLKASYEDGRNNINHTTDFMSPTTPEHYKEAVCQIASKFSEPLSTNVNKNCAQVLKQAENHDKDLKVLIALKRAQIQEMENEQLKLYNSFIELSEQALKLDKKALATPSGFTSAGVNKAKQCFHRMRDGLYKIIATLNPEINEELRDLLGDFLSSDTVYISTEDKDPRAVETLLKCNMITIHPYDHSQVKLAFR